MFKGCRIRTERHLAACGGFLGETVSERSLACSRPNSLFRRREPLATNQVCELGHLNTMTRPQIERDYPLNLSILLSGGKETNQDSLSSGE